MLSEVVDEYLEAGEPDSDGRGLYLFLHPDSAAFVVAEPTLQLFGHEHPRLPATYYHAFTGALNQWIRTYDHRDAEDRVQMLREWAEGEEEDYELADVAASVPACMKEKRLGLRTLRRIEAKARGEGVKALLTAVLDLERISALLSHPEFTDEMHEQLTQENDHDVSQEWKIVGRNGFWKPRQRVFRYHRGIVGNRGDQLEKNCAELNPSGYVLSIRGRLKRKFRLIARQGTGAARCRPGH
jgi:hypothetical protein